MQGWHQTEQDIIINVPELIGGLTKVLELCELQKNHGTFPRCVCRGSRLGKSPLNGMYRRTWEKNNVVFHSTLWVLETWNTIHRKLSFQMHYAILFSPEAYEKSGKDISDK